MGDTVAEALAAQLQRLLTLGMTVGTVDGPVALVEEVFDGLSVRSADAWARLRQQARLIAEPLTKDPRYTRAMELASLAQALTRRGDNESRACIAVLLAFAELTDRQPVAAAASDAPGAQRESELRAALREIHISPGAENVVTQSRLLESIVASAAKSIGARYGSLFLIDEQTHELVFEVSLREPLEELQRFRLPLGRGIAGLVAVTAQPIAVSDVARDPRHAAEIAEQTGYTPKNMLCVPLQSGERVIGVLQLLDKPERDDFTMADMQSLGSFANQAAATIEQSSLHHAVLRLVVRGLRQLAAQASGASSADVGLSVDPSANPVQGWSLELGQLVTRIAERDAAISSACATVLRSLADYARTTSQTGIGGPR